MALTRGSFFSLVNKYKSKAINHDLIVEIKEDLAAQKHNIIKVIKNGNDCINDLLKIKKGLKFRKKAGVPNVLMLAIDEQVIQLRRSILTDGELLESIEMAETMIKQYSFTPEFYIHDTEESVLGFFSRIEKII
jgi:hypothetical protein